MSIKRSDCTTFQPEGCHHHGFYYNATPEATPKRPMARPPTPKFPATAADPRSTISPARRHDPPRWGRAGPTGTCTPMGAPPEGETRGGTEGPRQPWGASVVIPPAGPGRQGQWARAVLRVYDSPGTNLESLRLQI